MPDETYKPADPSNEAEQSDTESSDEKKKLSLSTAKVLDILRDPLASVENYWRPYKEKYQRLERLYFGQVRKDSPAMTMQSRYSSGDAFELVETIKPRLIGNKFGVDIIGVEQEDADPARLVEQILDAQIETQHLDQAIDGWIGQAVKTVGGLLVDSEIVETKNWRKKRKYTMKLPVVNKEIGVGPLIDVQETKHTFRHILETVPWEDLIVPSGNSPDTLPFIGRKVRRTIHDMQGDERYDQAEVTKLKDTLVAKMKESPVEYKHERANQQDFDISVFEKHALEYEITAQEVYFLYEDEIYAAELTMDSTTVLRNECLENWHQMLPLRLLSLIPVENQAIGMSPLEAAEDQIDAEDTWINIVLQTALFDVMRPTAYDKKALGLNYRRNPPVYKPGMNLGVNGNPANAFTVLPAPKIDGSHQWLTQYFRSRFQNKTGVTDYISGADQIEGDKTKYEIQVKTAQSNKRFALNIKHIRRELSKVSYIMASNLQQYIPDNYAVRVLGKRGHEWKKVKPESIQGRFDFRVRGYESMAAEESETIGKFRNMLVDAANPLVRPFINIYELVKGLFVDGYKVDANSRILITPQERMEDEDKSKQAQAMDANSENLDPQTAVVRPDDDHAVHLDIHMAFVKSQAFGQLDPALQRVLAAHIDAHRKVMAMSGQPGQNGPTSPPMGQNGGPGALQPTPPVQSLVAPSDRDFTKR